MITMPDAARLDLDLPVPYTLTAKAYAALNDDPRPVEAADYVIPMCPGDDPGADWREMGWDSHDNAAAAHVAWCPNHPGYWKNGPAVMWEALLQQLDPDDPVPLTPTPKAIAFLDFTTHPVTQFGVLGDNSDGWARGRCGSGWFGPVPDDGQCRDCRAAV